LNAKIFGIVAIKSVFLAKLTVVDAVIGAVLVKGAKAPKLITKEMLAIG